MFNVVHQQKISFLSNFLTEKFPLSSCKQQKQYLKTATYVLNCAHKFTKACGLLQSMLWNHQDALTCNVLKINIKD